MDFRDEIIAQIYDRGDARPKRTSTSRSPMMGRRTVRSFPSSAPSGIGAAIGIITFDRAVVSAARPR
jgi:hypothetical protein